MKRFLSIFRRRLFSLGFAAASGVLAGIVAWCLFLPEPRGVIAVDDGFPSFSPNSKLLATVQNDLLDVSPWHQATIRIWDTTSCEEVRSIIISEASVEDVVFSSKKQQIAALISYKENKKGRFEVQVWSITGEKKNVICLPDCPEIDSCTCLTFDPFGRLRAVCYDHEKKRIVVWDVQRWKQIESTPNIEFLDRPFVLTIEKDVLIRRRGDLFKVARLLNGRWEQPPIFGFSRVALDTGVNYSADGKTALFLLNDTEQFRWWQVLQLETGESHDISTLPISGYPVLSPDGTLAAFCEADWISEKTIFDRTREALGLPAFSSSDKIVLALYDTWSGQKCAEIPGRLKAWFSPDSKILAVITDNEIQLWNLPIRRPWGKILLVAFGATLLIYLMLWLTRRTWSFFKAKRKTHQPLST